MEYRSRTIFTGQSLDVPKYIVRLDSRKTHGWRLARGVLKTQRYVLTAVDFGCWRCRSCVLRGLTFELRGRRRRGTLDSRRKMGRSPSA